MADALPHARVTRFPSCHNLLNYVTPLPFGDHGLDCRPSQRVKHHHVTCIKQINQILITIQ